MLLIKHYSQVSKQIETEQHNLTSVEQERTFLPKNYNSKDFQVALLQYS